MSSDSEKPSDEALFRQAVGDVTPIRNQARTDSRATPPEPRALQRRRDEKRVLEELLDEPENFHDLETGEELLFLRAGFQKKYLRRLRRGHYSVGQSLDLHQMNEERAGMAIREFIADALAHDMGCIRIIHGKGLRSKNGPVLKWLTRRLLSRHPNVIAFASCKPADGGTGAVNVLLRKR